jgi:hypothetical protein
MLTGGIAAAIMGGPGPGGWAAVTALLLILDAELNRRGAQGAAPCVT